MLDNFCRGEIMSRQYFCTTDTEEHTQIYANLCSRIARVNKYTEITAYGAGRGDQPDV
jgi:hypothetical protein